MLFFVTLLLATFGYLSCNIVPKDQIAVGEDCVKKVCLKRFLETGSKVHGDVVQARCISESYGRRTEVWECVSGDWQLQGESILCDVDCVGGDPCPDPPWGENVVCDTFPDRAMRRLLTFCDEEQIKQWQASDCQGPPPCSAQTTEPQQATEPTKNPNMNLKEEIIQMVTGEAAARNSTATSEEARKYEVTYFWPLAVLLFLPPIYWLILRTKSLSPCKRVVSIAMQAIIVAWIVYVFITRNHLFNEGIHAIRNEIGHLKLIYLLFGYAFLQIIRYTVPFLYFLFPLDTLFIFCMLLSTPLYEAVLWWQLITCCVSIVGFFLIGWLYGDWATRALENEKIEYFKEIRDLLSVFDGFWRDRFRDASLLMQTVYISSFFNAEFFSAYIGLFWMAVRGEMKHGIIHPNFTFIWSCILGFLLELPASIIQFRLISNALDSLEHSRFEMFKEFRWYEVVPYAIFTGFATCVVQWINICALANGILSCCCRNKVSKKDSITLGPIPSKSNLIGGEFSRRIRKSRKIPRSQV